MSVDRTIKKSRRSRRPAAQHLDAERWAKALEAGVRQVIAKSPQADPENVRHTLILLEQPPLERLPRSLIRGRRTTIFGR
jgi:hypothetical protein